MADNIFMQPDMRLQVGDELQGRERGALAEDDLEIWVLLELGRETARQHSGSLRDRPLK